MPTYTTDDVSVEEFTLALRIDEHPSGNLTRKREDYAKTTDISRSHPTPEPVLGR